MNLNSSNLVIAFFIFTFIVIENRVDAQNDLPNNQPQNNDNNDKSINKLKKSDEKIDINLSIKSTDQTSQDAKSNDKSHSSDILDKPEVKIDEKENSIEDDTNEYIYIKFNTLTKDDENSEEPESIKLSKSSVIRQAIKLNLNSFEDEVNSKNEELQKQDEKQNEELSPMKKKEKEIMISNTYPAIDLLKVHFKKNELTKKIEEDEEEIVDEQLTQEQLLGKQVFDDAIVKLETNRPHAFKLIDQAALLGYKEAEDYLIQGKKIFFVNFLNFINKNLFKIFYF